MVRGAERNTELQDLASYAARVIEAPVALVTSIGEDRLTFIANVGFARGWTSLEKAFCVEAVRQDGVFEVSDAAADPRFCDSPLVAGEPYVRFYAGVPVGIASEKPDGALCVLDVKPRTLTDFQRDTLEMLARQVQAHLALERQALALRESEGRYKALFDSMDQGFCVIEMIFDEAGRPIDLRFTEVNQAFERQSGIRREQVSAGLTVQQILPGLEDSWLHIYGRIALTGVAERFEMRAEPLGRLFDVYAFRLGGEGSRTIGIIFRDYTKREEENRTLAFLRSLTDAVIELGEPDAIMAIGSRMLGEHLGANRVSLADVSIEGDRATVRQDWTRGAASLVGTHCVADFGPRVVADYYAGELHVSRDAEEDYVLGEGLEAVRAVGAAAGISVPVLKEGRLKALLVVHQNSPRNWTESEIDLTRQVADRLVAEVERARAERALREANESLEARVQERTAELERAIQESEGFNYSISHDLRAPLRAMVSTSSILLQDLASTLSPEHRKLLERQAHNANRLGRLIDELLRLSRLARAEVRREPIDLTAMACSIWEEFDEHGRTNGCRFEVQEGLSVLADRGLVRTILQNLMGNACKFSPHGGTVRLRVRDGVFSLSDQGVGFDMAHASRLFQPFERLVREDEFEGTGIGLANVRRIVERHDGKVWVESAPGKGATFFFTLDDE